LAAAREYFAEQGVLEVETPILCRHGATDPQLHNIDCHLTQNQNARRFLRTSPEYHMKRLLAAGAPDIYEIGKAFRGGESGVQHEPEFTLIEWYRHDYTLDQIITDTAALIMHLSSHCKQKISDYQCFSYQDFFIQKTGVDPLTASAADLEQLATEVVDSELSSGLIAALGEDRSGWLDLILTHCLMAGAENMGLIAIKHYPTEQAMLARINPDNPGVADRFEFFYNGTELANGFCELTDAAEQAQRFANDQKLRAERNLPPIDADPLLLAALESGLQDCAGVALGLDRLIMCCDQHSELTNTISFSTS
jgi:lysyl-tRNA synthetase class 2